LAQWLLFHYKVPPDPSAARVYIWRKLKRLGAVYYHDAVWVLPKSPRTLEQFQWLASEIDEMGGEATLWSASPAFPGFDENLTGQFNAQVDQAYLELQQTLEGPDPDPDDLSRQYQRIKSRDYFQSELGQKLRDALLALRGGEV
jgi:hypothetical protein